MKLLKAISFILAALVLTTNAAVAADDSQHNEGSEGVQHQMNGCPCPQPCPCPKPCPCANNQFVPCAQPCCDPCYCPNECCRFIVFGDWLRWKVRKCELDYATPYTSSLDQKGHVKEVMPDWNSGYRIGVFRDCDDSYYGLRVTHFDSVDSSSSIDTVGSGNLAATRVAGGIAETAAGAIEYAAARYRNNLDVVDVEGGVTNCFGCDGAYSAFGGFRFASLDQHLSSIYTEDDTDRKGITSNADRVKQKNDMNAYGVYLGGGGYKGLCRGFGLFGRASAGWLLGKFERKFVQQSSAGTAPFATTVDLRDKCYHVITNLDLAIGLEYGFCGCCCNTWHIKFGYEFHSWLNTADFLDFVQGVATTVSHPDRHVGNVGYDGFFLRLQGDF